MPATVSAERAIALLAIALISLPALHLRLGPLTPVLREGLAHVVRLFELSLNASADETLVATRVDQFALRRPLHRGHRLLCHEFPPANCPCKWNAGQVVRCPGMRIHLLLLRPPYHSVATAVAQISPSLLFGVVVTRSRTSLPSPRAPHSEPR